MENHDPDEEASRAAHAPGPVGKFNPSNTAAPRSPISKIASRSPQTEREEDPKLGQLIGKMNEVLIALT